MRQYAAFKIKGRNRVMRRLLCTVASVLILMSGVLTAKADTMIESWDYTVAGGFINWQATPGSGVLLAGDAINLEGAGGPAYRTLSWGQEDGRFLWWEIDRSNERSAIHISDPASGTVYTDRGPATGLDLAHYNRAISSSYKTLSSGSVYLTLELTPNIEGLDSLPTFTTTLSFDFYETPNTGNLRNDIFVITNPMASMESFEYDGYWYNFSFFASFQDLNALYAEYVAAFLGDGQYYGWVTAENDTTTVPTFLQVSSGKIRDDNPAPTPEPGTMLLMGVGLAGLAFMARRRTKR